MIAPGPSFRCTVESDAHGHCTLPVAEYFRLIGVGPMQSIDLGC